MDGSEDFMINDIYNESESNYNGSVSIISSDCEWHKHISEMLIDDNLSQTAYYWHLNINFGIVLKNVSYITCIIMLRTNNFGKRNFVLRTYGYGID